mgnify:CR=1 FL=1
MFNEKVQKAMNDQIQHEIESAYIYLSMAAYFDDMNLPGFGQWMKIQFEEEMAHAFRFYNYIFERGGRVKLQAIDQPNEIHPVIAGILLFFPQKHFQSLTIESDRLNRLNSIQPGF